MKKLIVLALLIALCAGIAFADGVSIGAWGRGIYAPIMTASNGGLYDKYTNVSGVSWGVGANSSPRIGFGVTGNSEFVGFIFQIKGDGAGDPNVAVNDELSIWVKPVPGLKVQVGTFYDDTLRGSAGFGANDWIRPGNGLAFGDDFVFNRIGNASGKYVSALVSFQMAGFFAYVCDNVAGIQTYYGDNSVVGGAFSIDAQGNAHGNVASAQNLGDPITNLSFGAGYTIEGIGMIRVQKVARSWFDVNWSDAYYPISEVQAAFKLTMVKDLVVDLGVKIPMSVDSNVKAGATAIIPLYVSYKIAGAILNLGAKV